LTIPFLNSNIILSGSGIFQFGTEHSFGTGGRIYSISCVEVSPWQQFRG